MKFYKNDMFALNDYIYKTKSSGTIKYCII